MTARAGITAVGVKDPARVVPHLGGAPASVQVACGNPVCPQLGRQRRVWLRSPAPGVLEFPVLICAACSHRLPIVLPSNDNGTETPVPKVTVHGGPTHAAAEAEAAALAASDAAAIEAAAAEAVESDGPGGGDEGEDSGDGDEEEPPTGEPAEPGEPVKAAAKKTAPRKKTGGS